jgi:hypothetical protein
LHCTAAAAYGGSTMVNWHGHGIAIALNHHHNLSCRPAKVGVLEFGIALHAIYSHLVYIFFCLQIQYWPYAFQPK